VLSHGTYAEICGSVVRPNRRDSLNRRGQFLIFLPTMGPGPSGEDPDLESGNLAMSDHRVRRRWRSDRSSRGPDGLLIPDKTG
jgi:hypothetical protein